MGNQAFDDGAIFSLALNCIEIRQIEGRKWKVERDRESQRLHRQDCLSVLGEIGETDSGGAGHDTHERPDHHTQVKQWDYHHRETFGVP